MTAHRIQPDSLQYVQTISKELDHARIMVRVLERALRAEIMEATGVDVDAGNWELNTDTGVLVGEAFGEVCQTSN